MSTNTKPFVWVLLPNYPFTLLLDLFKLSARLNFRFALPAIYASKSTVVGRVGRVRSLDSCVLSARNPLLVAAKNQFKSQRRLRKRSTSLMESGMRGTGILTVGSRWIL